MSMMPWALLKVLHGVNDIFVESQRGGSLDGTGGGTGS